MKKITILVVATMLFLFSGFLMAQVNVGVVGGLNFADINANNQMSNRSVYAVGGILEYVFNNELTVSLEPVFIQKGSTQAETYTQPKGIIKFTYVEIPLLLKYTFKNNAGPFMCIGPSVSYLLESDVEMKANGFTFVGDTKKVTKAWDYGITFGGGFKMPFGRFSVIAECRYNLGLKDIVKEGTFEVSSGFMTETVETEDMRMKNQGLRVLMGVIYSL